MRVCIDCTPFLVRSAGVKAYIFQLRQQLRALAGEQSVHAFPFLDGAVTFHHEGSVVDPFATFLRMGLLYFVNLPGNHALDLLGRRIDLFHCSNQIRHPPRNARLTTMMHDMTAWSHPQLHTPATVTNDKRFAELVVKRADGVITPSESSRQDAIHWLGLRPDRVRAIHHGVSDAYFAAGPVEAAAARSAFGLHRPYVLFVSTIEPRKNVDRLLDAWADLSPELRDQFELVVAGPRGWAGEQTMARLETVRYLGYVPEAMLPGLTAGASAFAYPSLYEGFGFPVAQAMAAGVPVLTSDVSSLPEVTGGAAILVDPLSTAEIRAGLERLLLSPSLREDLASAARRHAEPYRWQRCALETWRFFEAL